VTSLIFEYQLPTEIYCYNSCALIIENVNYIVIWDWDWIQSNVDVDESETESYTESVDDEEENTEHKASFKVMGSPYSEERQEHLEKAYVEMKKSMENVKVKIEPDPDNDYDSNAIAVLLDYGDGWKLVGFILRDLTKYVHPVLKEGKLKSAGLENITFRTMWEKMGFYAKISLTCRGQWPIPIMRASTKAR